MKGIGQRRRVLDDAVAAGGVFIDDETATYRVVIAAAHLQPGRIERAENHTVGVEGQRLADELQIMTDIEANGLFAQQAQLAGLAYRRHARRNVRRIHAFRALAFKAEQHRLVTAVAFAGSAERAV